MRLLYTFLAAIPLLSAAATARENVSLQAGWQFQMDGSNIGAKEGWQRIDFDRSAWSSVAVPKAWNLYDEALWGYEGIGWYTVSIPGSLAKPGKIQRLKFGRVNCYSKVWLNGELLGENVGGWLPFEFDVTGKLRSGSANALVLRVDNVPRIEWLPAAKDIEWIQYGGLLAPVTLETTASVHVADLTINAVPQGSGASVSCTVAVRNSGPAERDVVLRVGVTGEEASWRSIPLKLAAGTTSVQNVSLSLENARRWSPESPSLYTATAAVESGGKTIDSVSDRFGVRKIEVRGREILSTASASA